MSDLEAVRRRCGLYALELEPNGDNFDVISTMFPSEGRRLILEDLSLENVEKFITEGLPAGVGEPKNRQSS